MKKICDFLPEIVTIIAIVLIFGGFLYAIYTGGKKHEDKLWNDGHCNICGGAWEYEQAVGHRSTASYIYVCRKCGKRIELNEVK